MSDAERPEVGATLDGDTRSLVRLAAAIAGLDESAVREAFASSRARGVPPRWIEELVLQSHLFSGFPRALNAAREWRRLAPSPLEPISDDPDDRAAWRARGEKVCARVYGPMYAKLRENVAVLHPALDDWMVVDGYGKVLGRPGLDLPRRELCIVAACAISGQDRQLHSHLHGALNVGVPASTLRESLDAIADLVGPERARSAALLLRRVLGS